jgi:hypothetical protein
MTARGEGETRKASAVWWGTKMLLEAVMLATSVAVSSATEAFAVPATFSYSVQATQPVDSVTAGSDQPRAAASVTRVSATSLLSLSGMSLLNQLGILGQTDLQEFVAAHPEVITELSASPPNVRDVDGWWSALDGSDQATLMATTPQLIGNLEGVPFGDRDRANRVTLDSVIAELRAVPAPGRSGQIDEQSELRMLDEVRAALVAPPGAPARYLLTLDPANGGTAAIVIGDLQSADYVSFLVPGMFYSVEGKLVDWASAAQTYYDTEADWIDRLGATNPHLTNATAATVAWIGYRTPGMIDFTSLDLAYDGRDAIAASINGLRALRGEDQPTLTVIGHSYGSTAAMMALSDLHVDVDAIAVVGSPGSTAATAADLGVRGDNVYVGEAELDQVEDTAFFGADPGSAAFGAHAFGVGGGFDDLANEPLAGSTGHDEYFAAGSESMRNLALIGLGQGFRATSTTGGALVERGVSALAQHP